MFGFMGKGSGAEDLMQGIARLLDKGYAPESIMMIAAALTSSSAMEEAIEQAEMERKDIEKMMDNAIATIATLVDNYLPLRLGDNQGLHRLVLTAAIIRSFTGETPIVKANDKEAIDRLLKEDSKPLSEEMDATSLEESMEETLRKLFGGD